MAMRRKQGLAAPGGICRGENGLVSFTKTLAVEEAPFGITVNMVCPGDIRGDNKEKTIAEVSGLSDGETPRGRPGSGEDIARVIRYLCHEDSDFITGNIMDVSGGLGRSVLGSNRPAPNHEQKRVLRFRLEGRTLCD